MTSADVSAARRRPAGCVSRRPRSALGRVAPEVCLEQPTVAPGGGGVGEEAWRSGTSSVGICKQEEEGRLNTRKFIHKTYSSSQVAYQVG